MESSDPTLVQLSAMSLDQETAPSEQEEINSSLRSFFPIEVVNEVLSHLDQASLGSLCRVSFCSLEEAGPILMKHVAITTWRAFESFFLQSSALVSSRLQPHLQSSFVRTLGIRVHWQTYPNTASARMRADTSQTRVFPPAHPLSRLTVAYPTNAVIAPLFGGFLSRFDPVHLELLAYPDREASTFKPGWYEGLPLPAVQRWTILRRVTCLGWLPPDLQSYRPSFIARLPPSDILVELDLDLRWWYPNWTDSLPRVLSLSGALALQNLRSVRWTVKEGEQEKIARDRLVRLPKEERDKVELVVV